MFRALLVHRQGLQYLRATIISYILKNVNARTQYIAWYIVKFVNAKTQYIKQSFYAIIVRSYDEPVIRETRRSQWFL